MWRNYAVRYRLPPDQSGVGEVKICRNYLRHAHQFKEEFARENTILNEVSTQRVRGVDDLAKVFVNACRAELVRSKMSTEDIKRPDLSSLSPLEQSVILKCARVNLKTRYKEFLSPESYPEYEGLWHQESMDSVMRQQSELFSKEKVLRY